MIFLFEYKVKKEETEKIISKKTDRKNNNFLFNF